MKKHEIDLPFSKLTVEISDVGNDKMILVYGGDKPHIGCTVLSIPRDSLTGDGSISATSSVLNVIGHKDELICRAIAERIAARDNCTVVCSGGFHIDKITKEQIDALMAAISLIP